MENDLKKVLEILVEIGAIGKNKKPLSHGKTGQLDRVPVIEIPEILHLANSTYHFQLYENVSSMGGLLIQGAGTRYRVLLEEGQCRVIDHLYDEGPVPLLMEPLGKTRNLFHQNYYLTNEGFVEKLRASIQ